jgi:hypothetical protein
MAIFASVKSKNCCIFVASATVQESKMAVDVYASGCIKCLNAPGWLLSPGKD